MANIDVDKYPSSKKVWQYVQIAPCPFRQNFFYAIQELIAVHSEDGPDETIGKKNTRVVLMEIDDKGFARNANGSGYNGPRIYNDNNDARRK